MMTDLFEYEDLPEANLEEDIGVSSLNHALVQTHLIKTLPDDQFTVATELSLDVSSSERQAILKKYHLL